MIRSDRDEGIWNCVILPGNFWLELRKKPKEKSLHLPNSQKMNRITSGEKDQKANNTLKNCAGWYLRTFLLKIIIVKQRDPQQIQIYKSGKINTHKGIKNDRSIKRKKHPLVCHYR